MSPGCMVYRSFRQDVGQALADPADTTKEGERGFCHVINRPRLSIACATIRTSEFLNDIQFKTYPPPTPTPLCKHHYHAVYDMLRQNNCWKCSRHLQAGNDRHCPQSRVVEAYLHKCTAFTIDISESDRVCFTCYKSHLQIPKQNLPTSTDEDLRPLVESVRGDVGTGNDIINTATNKMLYDVGTMLLQNPATLLPVISASFYKYARELAEKRGAEESPEVNSRWILSEIKAKYKHHVACVCKVQKYGTLVFRPTSDIYACSS